MNTLPPICFDMDGTLADLYGCPNWLDRLREFDPTPYIEAKPMLPLKTLARHLNRLQNNGHKLVIISWLSKESTPEYDNLVRITKKEWLGETDFPYDHFHGVKYGATKADSVRKYLHEGETAILFDDNAKVRQGWHLGEAIDPTACDLLEVLRNLVEG